MWMPALVLGLLLTTTDAPPSGSATVPLPELIKLYGQKEHEAAPPEPPARALVVKSQLKGRLTAEAMLVEAHFEVEVLADESWTQVKLLRLDADTYLTALPSLEGATVAALDEHLTLVTRRSGRHVFDVSFTLRPTAAGPERQAQLRFGPHVTPVPLRLEADATAFTLTEPALASSEEVEVYPRQGVLRVGWRTTVAPKVARQVIRPPLEPSIPEAHATWVSTLEGKASLRVRYALRLDREQPLELTLPEGHHLERVLLDSAPLVPEEKEGRLLVKVAPTRVGETEATMEVVLTRDLGVFHLSGRLKLALPRVSWPVATLQARAHFPAVFNYRREGGSMEPDEAKAEDAPDTSTSLPGKVLHFRQYLVAASAPTLELGYSVDISQSYFR
ncbi:hypothetical protein CYFUS_004985 [Cystobacter fuscus]|uniref:Uncharacterized protein n=2 Tax=Cystobacter fuscus TaxID=43 RepID=A0A250J7Y6_9BACT|nr:hypothetical protein CYFUS_004985 [Cystobacter fuscus]